MKLNHEKNTKKFHPQLLEYVKTRCNSEVKDMLKNIKIDQFIDTSGRSLLHWSAEFGNLEMMQYFIVNQCNINAQDNNGNTPLMLAVEAGEYYAIEALIRVGANVYIINKKGNCPIKVVLSSWILSGRWVVKLFLDRLRDDCGTDKVELVNKLMDFQCPIFFAVLLRDAEVTGVLLDRGCWIEARCLKTFDTALHEAVAQSDLANVKILIDRGHEINCINYRKQTPLCRYNIWTKDSKEKLEILKFLIAKGAEIHCKKSPLKRMFKEGNKETVYTLLGIEGINLRLRHSEGKTALHLICVNENPGMAEALLLFPGKDFDINAVDEDGHNALMIAANKRCVNKVERLLKLGASVNGNHKILSALYEVSNPENDCISESQENYRKIVDLLLQHGADVRLRREITFLEEATMKRDFDIAKSFLARLAQMKVLDGYRVDRYTLEEIRRVEKYEVYFGSCMKHLEEMKKFIVHESITLLRLLTGSKKQLKLYARSDEFVLKFNTIVIKKFETIPHYYSSTIQKRVTAAIERVNLERKAVGHFCKIVGLSIDKLCIAFSVFDYLNEQDMKSFIESM